MLFLVIPALFYSQEEEIKGEEDIVWVNLNAPQLSKSDLLWLDTVTRTGLAQQYETALAFLDRQIHEGLISSADYIAVSLLKRIALHPHILTVAGPDIIHRQRAIQLIGKLGGEHSLTAVDEILTTETEPPLLIAIFLVYTDIAPPFNTMRSQYFTKHLKRANLIAGHEGLILSILRAIDRMHKRTWSMNDAELFAEILAVANAGRTYGVRQEALLLARFLAGLDDENGL